MNTAPISVLDITNSAGSVPLLDVLEQIRTLADHYEDELVQREQMRALAALLFLGLFQKLTDQRPQPTLEPTDSISQRDFLIDEFFNLHFGLNDGNERLAKLLCISPEKRPAPSAANAKSISTIRNKRHAPVCTLWWFYTIYYYGSISVK